MSIKHFLDWLWKELILGSLLVLNYILRCVDTSLLHCHTREDQRTQAGVVREGGFPWNCLTRGSWFQFLKEGDFGHFVLLEYFTPDAVCKSPLHRTLTFHRYPWWNNKCLSWAPETG
jgi:hypothetical protein